MFYANHGGYVRTNDTHIEFDRVFSGQYWDEFAVGGLLGPKDSTRISLLLLGLALGGAIRPILSTGRVSYLCAVDNNLASTNDCKDLFTRHFPDLRFDTIVCDAGEYLSACTSRYDVIVVDLYSTTSYSFSMFDTNFYDLLSDCLSPGGHIVFNAFGLPMHLDPLGGASPQRHLAARLTEYWSVVYTLPYRRNFTFITGGDEFPQSNEPVHAGLHLGDRIALQVAAARLSQISAVTVASHNWSPDDLVFQAIDAEMRARWLGLLPKLSVLFDREIKTTSDLRPILGDPALCVAAQNYLAATNDPLLRFLPIMIAGEVNVSEVNTGWLIDWATDVLAADQNVDRQQFIEYVLSQVTALLINPRVSNAPVSLLLYHEALALYLHRA